MIDADEQIELLRRFCPAARLVEEGGGKAALLPQHDFEHLGVAHTMDVLLFPFPYQGYDTGLLFERRLAAGSNPNQIWQQRMAIGRLWEAPSVRYVPADQPWPSIIAAFLRVIS